MTYNAFIFDAYTFNSASGELSLRYAYENGPEFEEKIIFPPATRPLTPEEKTALDKAFRLIFLLAGVSYYKAYIPETLTCRAFPLDQNTAAFIEKVYRHGLAEFAYRNKVDLTNLTKLKFSNPLEPRTPNPDLSAVALAKAEPRPVRRSLGEGGTPNPDLRLLIPIGGGKDSIVTLETLKQGIEKSPPPLGGGLGGGSYITLFALGGPTGPAEPIRKTIETSDLPHLYVTRALSPTLNELNQQGALNGHIPITAILSSIAVACAILHSHDTVVMSNEHSASAPNVSVNGIDVNHQYSKSFAFEKDFAQYIQNNVTPKVTCFSLLRPLTETAIVKRFAKLDKYHAVFRSCNTAFRQDEKQRGKNWCCDCPKCRFIFLALAPFLPKEKLIAIFGKNMLADETQTQGFADLCGLGDHKPFECVGEIEESALLMQHLANHTDWKNDNVVKKIGHSFTARIDQSPPPLGGGLGGGSRPQNKNLASLLDLKPNHLVPDNFMEMLRAHP